MDQKIEDTGVISKQPDYSIEVKYSPEAIEKKLIRFTTTKNGDSFEITADQLINLLATQVNAEILAPTFVETERVNVVQVLRQISCRLDKDMQKGEELRINYTHPYPIEFALIEESYKIAEVQMLPGRIELTKEFIDGVKAKLQPQMDEFTKKFYQSFKTINVGVEPDEKKA